MDVFFWRGHALKKSRSSSDPLILQREAQPSKWNSNKTIWTESDLKFKYSFPNQHQREMALRNESVFCCVTYSYVYCASRWTPTRCSSCIPLRKPNSVCTCPCGWLRLRLWKASLSFGANSLMRMPFLTNRPPWCQETLQEDVDTTHHLYKLCVWDFYNMEYSQASS